MCKLHILFGVNNKGGGTVGAIIAYPLVSLFSEYGAAVISLGITAFLLVFTFGLKPSNWLLDLSDKMEEAREIRKEEAQERELAREERRKARREAALDGSKGLSNNFVLI